MSEHEEWREVTDFPDYEISSLGRLISHRNGRPRLLSPAINSTGYRRVELNADGQSVKRYIHSIVAGAFHGPRPEGSECRHLNGDRLDNRAENLAWGSKSENMRDAIAHGTHPTASKTHCSYGHAFDEANTYQRPSGGRDCRSCRRTWRTAYQQRQMLRAAHVSERAA